MKFLKLLILFSLLIILFSIEKSFGEWKAVGPYSGVITSVVIDKKGHLYTGTEGSGVYKSIDKGESWLPVDKGIDNPFIASLSISPKGVIYAGTKDGIYKSENGGENWARLSGLPSGYQVQYIAFDSDTIYAALWSNAIYRSNDEKNWEMLKEGLSNPFVNCILIDKDGNIYAASEGGAYRMQRKDKKWESAGLVENVVTSAVMDKKGMLYVSTWRDGVFRTTDRGDDWKGVTKGLSNSYIRCLVMDKKGFIYAATEEGVERFDPESERWTKIGLDGVNMKFLNVDDEGRVYAGSYGTGLFIGKGEPIKWERRSRGITNLQVLSILVDRGGNIYAGTTWGLFEKSQDGEWVEVDVLAGRRVQSLIADEKGRLFVGTATGMFMFDRDKRKWIRMEKEMGIYNITSMTIDSNGVLYAGTDMDGIYMSKDGGKEWKSANEGLSSLRILKLIKKDRDIYAGTYSGIFTKSLNSEKWQGIGGEIGNRVIKSVVADKSGNIYAGIESGGVYITADGKIWKAVNEGLGNLDVLSLSADKKGIIYVGTYGGIFLKASPDAPWKDYSSSLTNRIVQTIINDGDKLYIGTWGAGIWSR